MSKRILVVEDYHLLLDLIDSVLEEVGRYSVETALNGEIARRLLADHAFDAVVLDIGLPGKPSGPEIAAMARARQLPILFITGRDPAEVDSTNAFGMNNRFLRKPFTMDVLLSEVAALLGSKTPKIRKASRRLRSAPGP